MHRRSHDDDRRRIDRAGAGGRRGVAGEGADPDSSTRADRRTDTHPAGTGNAGTGNAGPGNAGPETDSRDSAVPHAPTDAWLAQSSPGAEHRGEAMLRRSPFAAGTLDDPCPRVSPFGVEPFPEAGVVGSSAEMARELACLTGESVTEAVEKAIEERLGRYRLRDVGIAQRLARLSREVAGLRTPEATASTERVCRREPPEDAVPNEGRQPDRQIPPQVFDVRT